MEEKYEVLIDNKVISREMSLNYAILLAEGIFQKYYADKEISVVIRRMKKKGEDGR